MVWCFRSVPKSYLTDNVALSVVLKKSTNPDHHCNIASRVNKSWILTWISKKHIPPLTSPKIKYLKPEAPPVALVVIFPRFLAYSQVGNHGSDCLRYTYNLVKQMVCITERKNINFLVEYFENRNILLLQRL